MKRILVIPDTHGDAIHPNAISFLKKVAQKYSPNEVVHIGDEVDFAYWGSHDIDPDILGGEAGLQSEIESIKPLYELFPKVKACIGNHTYRIHTRAFKSGLPQGVIKDMNQILQAPKGWKWADYWIIDDIMFEHGIGLSGKNGALAAAEKNRMSTVIGHLHSWASVQWTASKKDILFGMNVGCLVDIHHPKMKYAKYMRNKPILGCGLIIDGVPRFIPMVLDKNGSWIGKIY